MDSMQMKRAAAAAAAMLERNMMDASLNWNKREEETRHKDPFVLYEDMYDASLFPSCEMLICPSTQMMNA